jgi:hypothetical protein
MDAIHSMRWNQWYGWADGPLAGAAMPERIRTFLGLIDKVPAGIPTATAEEQSPKAMDGEYAGQVAVRVPPAPKPILEMDPKRPQWKRLLFNFLLLAAVLKGPVL